MVRTKQAPEKTASKVIAVRLTPPQFDVLLNLVAQANRNLATQGLAPLVSPASLMLSAFLRAAEAAGFPLLNPEGTGNPTAPFLVHGPRKRPRGTKAELPPPTRLERALNRDIANESKPKKRGQSKS